MRMIRIAACLACVAGTAFALTESVTVTPILRATTTASGQPIELPSGPVQVTVSRFEIAPGATLPVHRHPFPRYAYVISGMLRVTDVESGKATTYHAGDFIVETVGTWHYGTNIGSDQVVLIVTDQTPPDRSNTELRDH